MEDSDKREWGKRGCNNVVGGPYKTKCPGRPNEVDYMKIFKSILNYIRKYTTLITLNNKYILFQ